MIRTKTFHGQNTLQLKILSRYLLFILLVGGIIAAVWYEKRVFVHASEEELAILEQHKLSDSLYKSMLLLFLDNEGVILWDNKDLQAYRDNELQFLLLMKRLRSTCSDSLQQARIDRIENLLQEKRKQEQALAGASALARPVDSILSERLSSPYTPIPVLDESEGKKAGDRKKGSLFSWLKRKKKDQAASFKDGRERLQYRTFPTGRARRYTPPRDLSGGTG